MWINSKGKDVEASDIKIIYSDRNGSKQAYVYQTINRYHQAVYKVSPFTEGMSDRGKQIISSEYNTLHALLSAVQQFPGMEIIIR